MSYHLRKRTFGAIREGKYLSQIQTISKVFHRLRTALQLPTSPEKCSGEGNIDILMWHLCFQEKQIS